MAALEDVRPLDNETWRAIRHGLGLPSAAMMRAFLRYYNRRYAQNLALGSNDNREQLIDRIHGYLSQGSIGLDTMLRALLDFADFGSKSVYLYRLGPQAKARLAKMSTPRRVADLSHARITIGQRRPNVSYSYLDAYCFRVSFSELQKRAYIKPGSYLVVEEEVNRFVAMVANLGSGLVTLHFDSEVGQNVGRGDEDYHDYYTARVSTLLEADLRPVDLGQKLEMLEEMAPSDNSDPSLSSLVRMPTGRFKTRDGFVQLTGYDYRRMSAYSDVSKTLAAKIYGQYVWLRENELPESFQNKFRGQGLLREVFTKIDAYPARVRFMADVLREEVEYVLRQLT